MLQMEDMRAGGRMESRSPAQHQVKGRKEVEEEVEERIYLSRLYTCLAADTYIPHYGKVWVHVFCLRVSPCDMAFCCSEE